MTKGPLIGIAVIAAAGAIVIGATSRDRPGADRVTGAAMVEVRVPDLSATAQLGRKSFEENCVACHGTNASGREGLGPPLVHRIYEPGHHGDGAFVLAVRQGVVSHHWGFGKMAPVEGLSDARIAAIIAYVRELQRANGIH